ncbi:MAG: histidine kinase [Lachnospiraceae bacterium]|nr:histidine kinase [Lachnospiraceae bacterium]
MRTKNRTVNFRILMYLALTIFILVVLATYYYLNMRDTLTDEVYGSLKRDAAYISGRVDETVTQVIDAAKGPGYTTALQKTLFSDDAGEKLANISTSRELIASARDQNEYIADLFYYSSTGHLYTVSEYYEQFRANMKFYEFDHRIKLESEFISNRPIHDREATFYFLYIPIHRTAMGIAHRTRESGICAILCNFAPIAENCADIIGENDSCYYIYNKEILSSLRPVKGLSEETLLSLPKGDSEIEVEGEAFFVHTFKDENGKYVALAPKALVSLKNFTVDRNFYLMIAASVFIFALLLFLLNKEYTKKTEKMVSELNNIKLSGSNMRVSVPQVSELKEVALEINSMLDRLEDSAKREQKARENLLNATLAQQEAEMTAYRSQINPHFFFNTLECVRSMAQYYNAGMIEDIITAMSKIFRYSLYSDMIVELSAEVDMLRQYFVITDYRFPGKYVLKEEIDENTLSYRVPSMILQPLVENCIKHAFVNMPAGRKNEITVKARYTEEGLLKLSVSDNGCGMSEEAMEHLRESVFTETDSETRKDSIGVKNIYERVKLFDKMNQMRFYSSPGEYTKVELILHPAFINKQ